MRYRAIKVGYLRQPFGAGGRLKTVEVAIGEEFELPAGAKPGRWMEPVGPVAPEPAKAPRAPKVAKAPEPVEPPAAPPASDEAL